MNRIVISPHYDPDLAEAETHGPDALMDALKIVCACGHPRVEHFGASGSLASFGGSACALCWECPTFRPTGVPDWPPTI